MFTGIVAATGEVIDIREGAGSRRLTVRTALPLYGIKTGASVACDGCCLTVVEKGANTLSFDAAAETLSLTTLGTWTVGTEINLEMSLKMGDELGGHMVSGHIDGLATVESVKPDGDAWRLTIRPPAQFMKLIAPKGSIALNGISLTVNEVGADTFGVCIIPHTWQVTNIRHWTAGTKVNIETDMMARYVARILGKTA